MQKVSLNWDHIPPPRLTFALQVKEEEDELDLLLQQAEALYR